MSAAQPDERVAPAAQEPVAWIDPDWSPGKPYGKVTSPVTAYPVHGWTPLYAHVANARRQALEDAAQRCEQSARDWAEAEAWESRHAASDCATKARK